ncbi:MAG: hypothetical protein KF757_02760 [Phycisphaeraceae bacterium]|nr:hypothetical protein [Phycisphaeraceae bacterium]MCW5764293.1 hypothetical protein [Phycisphaeraceae bacterium]
MHYALIADLIDSRLVKNRAALAERLGQALEELRVGFASEWTAALTSTKGIDELSAALVRPDRAFEIAVALNERVWPHRFRWALGCGAIDIGLDSGDAGALDGSAFHRAADALARAKREKMPFAVMVPEAPESLVMLTEAAAAAHGRLMHEWSARQREFVIAARVHETQLGAAEALGVSAQTISRSLSRAGFDLMQRIENAVHCGLSEMGSAGSEGG